MNLHSDDMKVILYKMWKELVIMKEVYEELEKYQIPYEKVEHEAVFSVEQSQKIKKQIEGVGCKNLFLKDQKKNYYLIILDDQHQISLKEIALKINSKRLSFASPDELWEILGLYSGSVSPFGILNDKTNKCMIVIENTLENQTLLFHPNINTATISLDYSDFIKFIKLKNHAYQMIKLENQS